MSGVCFNLKQKLDMEPDNNLIQLHKLLAVLNACDSPESLVARVPDRRGGRGRGLSPKLAAQLLEARDEQPNKRFSNVKQVLGIPGLGKDTLQDLLAGLVPPADFAFHQAMYNGVILDNWELEYFVTPFEDAAAFEAVTASAHALANWVAGQVEQISVEKYSNSKAAELAGALLSKCYVEHFPDPHYGAYALAFWFYQFDADNWFTFERVRAETERYLNYYPVWEGRLELYLFKGFDNAGVLVSAMAQDDLPVVVNRGEQSITIWTCQLND